MNLMIITQQFDQKNKKGRVLRVMGVEGKACLFLKTVDPGVRTEKVEYFNQFKTNKTNNSLFTQ